MGLASQFVTCGLLQALPAWNTNEVTLTFMPRLEGLQLALLKWIQTFLNISLLKYSQISLQVHESVHLSGPIAARSPHGGEDHPLCIQSDGASKGEYGIGVSHKKAAWAPSVTTPSSSQVGKPLPPGSVAAGGCCLRVVALIHQPERSEPASTPSAKTFNAHSSNSPPFLWWIVSQEPWGPFLQSIP